MNKPIYNLNAERALLGSIMLKPDLIYAIQLTLNYEDFYNRFNQEIYKTMQEISKSGKIIDSVLIEECINESYKSNFLMEFADYLKEGTTISSRVKNYLEIIREYSDRRKIINTIQEIEHDQTSTNIIEILENTMIEINTRGSGNNRPKNINEILDEEERTAEEIKKHGKIEGIKTYIESVDKRVNLANGDLIILAARPSMGKTAFAINIAYNNFKQDKKGLMFSLEMNNRKLLQRIIANIMSIKLDVVKKHFENGKIKELLGNRYNEIRNLFKKTLLIDDKANNYLNNIISTAKIEKMKNNIDFIILDHITLIRTNEKFQRKDLQVSYISKSLKQLARDLKIPVICLSQLSRAVEQRSDKRPMLSDLRESGALEEDADTVIFLYRDEYYNEDTEMKGIMEIITSKNRDGETGNNFARFFGEYQRIQDYTTRIN